MAVKGYTSTVQYDPFSLSDYMSVIDALEKKHNAKQEEFDKLATLAATSRTGLIEGVDDDAIAQYEQYKKAIETAANTLNTEGVRAVSPKMMLDLKKVYNDLLIPTQAGIDARKAYTELVMKRRETDPDYFVERDPNTMSVKEFIDNPNLASSIKHTGSANVINKAKEIFNTLGKYDFNGEIQYDDDITTFGGAINLLRGKEFKGFDIGDIELYKHGVQDINKYSNKLTKPLFDSVIKTVMDKTGIQDWNVPDDEKLKMQGRMLDLVLPELYNALGITQYHDQRWQVSQNSGGGDKTSTKNDSKIPVANRGSYQVFYTPENRVLLDFLGKNESNPAYTTFWKKGIDKAGKIKDIVREGEITTDDGSVLSAPLLQLAIMGSLASSMVLYDREKPDDAQLKHLNKFIAKDGEELTEEEQHYNDLVDAFGETLTVTDKASRHDGGSNSSLYFKFNEDSDAKSLWDSLDPKVKSLVNNYVAYAKKDLKKEDLSPEDVLKIASEDYMTKLKKGDDFTHTDTMYNIEDFSNNKTSPFIEGIGNALSGLTADKFTVLRDYRNGRDLGFLDKERKGIDPYLESHDKFMSLFKDKDGKEVNPIVSIGVTGKSLMDKTLILTLTTKYAKDKKEDARKIQIGVPLSFLAANDFALASNMESVLNTELAKGGNKEKMISHYYDRDPDIPYNVNAQNEMHKAILNIIGQLFQTNPKAQTVADLSKVIDSI